MEERATLRSHLEQSASLTRHGVAVAEVMEAMAAGAIDLAALIADGPLAGITGRVDGVNTDGDQQKDIDLAADDIMRRALRHAPVAAILSEEAALPEILNPEAPLCVAIDPLDGSANLENNISVGTIFSIRPRGNDVLSTFFEPGTAQCAAGFVVYGPQTTLVLAFNASVDIFILDRRTQRFLLIREGVQVAPDTAEFAINASNLRHWHGPVRAYIDECLAGSKGNRGADFNMRWIGSLVAEALRILVHGGVFLYPADARPGYHEGRLRLLYEAHPMALVMEWAGGAATNGRRRILELGAMTPHQRVPLIMGSVRGVRDVAAIHEGIEPMFDNSDAPLFARRGLFRAGSGQMSRSHPIISITGSSGAGTTSVKKTFENIFRRENVLRPTSKATPSIVTIAPRCARKRRRRTSAATGTSAISAPKPICSRSWRRLFRDYGESGTGTTRHYVHDDDEAKLYGADPGTFTEWGPLPENSDLLFYEGLHGAVVTDKVNIAQYADLKIGVVPVINLEWIQKLHRDRSDRGYSAEAVTDTILRRMPDYVNYICPQFAETDINFQRVPTVDTSNPFIARWIPTPDESMVVIRLRESARHRFPLSAVDDPAQLHVARQFDRDPRREARPRDAAHSDPADPATDGTQEAHRMSAPVLSRIAGRPRVCPCGTGERYPLSGDRCGGAGQVRASGHADGHGRTANSASPLKPLRLRPGVASRGSG